MTQSHNMLTRTLLACKRVVRVDASVSDCCRAALQVCVMPSAAHITQKHSCDQRVQWYATQQNTEQHGSGHTPRTTHSNMSQPAAAAANTAATAASSNTNTAAARKYPNLNLSLSALTASIPTGLFPSNVTPSPLTSASGVTASPAGSTLTLIKSYSHSSVNTVASAVGNGSTGNNATGSNSTPRAEGKSYAYTARLVYHQKNFSSEDIVINPSKCAK